MKKNWKKEFIFLSFALLTVSQINFFLNFFAALSSHFKLFKWWIPIQIWKNREIREEIFFKRKGHLRLNFALSSDDSPHPIIIVLFIIGGMHCRDRFLPLPHREKGTFHWPPVAAGPVRWAVRKWRAQGKAAIIEVRSVCRGQEKTTKKGRRCGRMKLLGALWDK